MKIRCTKKDLLDGIQKVHNIVSLRSTLPILSNILIETKKNTVRLIATDLDIGVVSSINVEVDEEGSITAPAKKFLDVVKELPDNQEITITAQKNNNITIEAQKVFFKMIGLPKEEFPKLPEFKNPELIVLDQYLLKQMLSKTAFAISHDESRYVLNGILVVIGPKTIKLVATDGRRLAMIQKQTNLPKQFESSPQKIIIPTKAVQELVRALEDEGEVQIKLNKNQISFNLGKTTIITRLIEGEFPSYEQVIPKKNKPPLIINKEQLLFAAKRAGIFTTQQSQAIKIDVSKNKMVISKTSPEFGEVKEEIDIVYGGPSLTIGINPGYLVDVLKNLNLDDVEFELISPDKPGVIRVGDEYVYVVLPMQLS